MTPFNIFKGFSGFTRDRNRAEGVRHPYSRRERLVKTPGARQSEEFTPTASRHASSDHENFFESENAYIMQSGWPSSTIPAVHRTEINGRIHENFSDEGETFSPTHQRFLRNGSCATSSASDGEARRSPILISATTSSNTRSETDSHDRYLEVEEPRPFSSSPSWYEFQPYTPSSRLSLNQYYSPLGQSSSLDEESEQASDEYDSHTDSGIQSCRIWHSSDGTQTYYIVPAGINVIFQDESGNEITRVGDFGPRHRSSRRRKVPIIIQDEDGVELYRSDSSVTSYGSHSSQGSFHNHRPIRRERGILNSQNDNSGHASYLHFPYDHGASEVSSSRSSKITSTSSESSPSHDNIILIDDRGRQIPITSTSSSRSSQSRPHRSGRSRLYPRH